MSNRCSNSAPSQTLYGRVVVETQATGRFRPMIDSRSARTMMRDGRSCGSQLVQGKVRIPSTVLLLVFLLEEGLVASL